MMPSSWSKREYIICSCVNLFSTQETINIETEKAKAKAKKKKNASNVFTTPLKTQAK